MLKNYLFTLLLFIFSFPVLLHAQYDNVWVFGLNYGLDFNAGSPLSRFTTPFGSFRLEYKSLSNSFSGPWVADEPAASICDKEGTLLFYTSGGRIWDRSGKVMPNGDSLMIIRYDTTGTTNCATCWGLKWEEATLSCAQGALIVPAPNEPDRYYVFSLTSSDDKKGRESRYLYYHVVDMQLNGGMGDVVAGQKKIFVDSGFTEQMTSVAGDDCNIWVVLSTAMPTKPGVEFKAFEVNANGVNPTPIISNAGIPPGAFLRASTISISPDRRKLVATRDASILAGSAELYDFDPSSGTVSNQVILIPNANIATYGACFSPDNTKVYISEVFPGGIWQYDVSSNNASAIVGSAIKLNNVPLTALRRGPDGKIYYRSNTRPGNIATISLPNLSGMASRPDDTVAVIANDTMTRAMYLGLPNVISTIRRDPDTLYTLIDTFICFADGLVIQSPVEEKDNVKYLWEDGSAVRERTITSSGTFWVKSSDYCRTRVDTFKVELVNLEQPFISINGFELTTGQGYASYQWLLNEREIPAATGRTHQVTENGNYKVVVTNSKGCRDTSDIYKVTNVSIDDIAALNRSVYIYPNPAQDKLFISAPLSVHVRISGMEGKLIKTAFNPVSIAIDELPVGVYMLHITDESGRLLKVDKFVKIQ